MFVKSICYLGFLLSCTCLAETMVLAQVTLKPPRLTITESSHQDSVVIVYDLEANEAGLQFSVTPYLDSAGSRQWITSHVWGSVGDTITPGVQKRIVWNYYRAFPNGYQGTMKLGLAYELVPPSATLSLAKERYRRGSSINLSVGDLLSPYYHIIDEDWHSYQQGMLAGNNTRIKLPKQLPLKRAYRIRLEDDQGRIFYTPSFTVRRYIPLSALIGIPAAATGAILYFILQKDTLPEPYALPEN